MCADQRNGYQFELIESQSGASLLVRLLFLNICNELTDEYVFVQNNWVSQLTLNLQTPFPAPESHGIGGCG